MASVRAARELGIRFRIDEVVAIRGERLALFRATARTEAGDEPPALVLRVLGPDGRFVFDAYYDEHDQASALSDLDARLRAGRGR